MKVYIVVLHLLLLNQMAQSYVLLTANIEDIKKLAKKFVSESLAEKIADFIARATEQMIANVSEENEKNENRFPDISTENNNMYNTVMKRNQKDNQQKPKQRYQKIKELPNKSIKKMTKPTKKAANNRQKIIDRVNLKNMPPRGAQNLSKFRKEPERSFEKYNPAKQYSYTIKERHRIYKNHPKFTEIPQLDSTIGVAEKILPEDVAKLKILPDEASISRPKFLGPNRFHLTANSKENETIQPNDFETMQKVSTTKKEKNEFDPYDKPKYPKPEYVATSGPVVLPKIPSEDWWKKDDKEFKRNKDWD